MYSPKNKIRIVTSTSLFDGHDAAINIMRRILQASGAEIIHLGHNRGAEEIVECAIQEDVQAIAITSYQGGHLEFFKYLYNLLKQRNSNHIKIFGGGGGTILPAEIKELHQHGITRLYSPDDGRKMGLQGMIDTLLEEADFNVGDNFPTSIEQSLTSKTPEIIARAITLAENHANLILPNNLKPIPVLGITGTGGAGKSSLTDEFTRRFLRDFPGKHLAIISIDPSRRKSGGALLGDRIRMNSVFHPHVYMRSMATRESHAAVSPHVKQAIEICKASDFDLIVVETSGIGQSDSSISDISNVSLYVMTPEYGAATQLEKIDMLDFADIVAINKFDKKGAEDALRDVKKQYRRNHNLWETPDDEIPVFPSIASQFNDPGMETLYREIISQLHKKTGFAIDRPSEIKTTASGTEIIPSGRERYLAEIVEIHEQTKQKVAEQKKWASLLYRLKGAQEALTETSADHSFENLIQETEEKLEPESKKLLEEWPAIQKNYSGKSLKYTVRDKEFEIPLTYKSLSQQDIPKISLPKFSDWGDLLEWLLTENVPGTFPYTAGVFPFKRTNEDPTRMFAGEGGPERTNKRFHYLSEGLPAKRLSTAFDSVTLYGEDPDFRPDIFGKIGNSGVSIATLDDSKKLYSGFNLCDPATSVSMTINGPAPMLLAFFLNTAIDQQCELYIRQNGLLTETQEKIKRIFSNNPQPEYSGELPANNDGLGLLLLGLTGDQVLEKEIYETIKTTTLSVVRGTVQADILKEDQAQNTCIFSLDFALKMMGDIQEYFIDQKIRNFYSVSISGYHIAEAGANPITQLAFTLANGFTYIENYLARGMKVDDFAPSFSFFFSNGMDPEYSVMGRVARRIWAKALKYKYGANERSQKLKYHIQTSGRSLHAQEIAFNDIRTTLQALYAIYDNCNSLHTNAYDEAITTPTEESVRRAVAIQLIINQELGLAKNENPLQGAFIIEDLTNLVEEAVMLEFRRLSERGGVPGAMERMYQRSKIQEESMYYETRKQKGELPIIGVNTFLSTEGSPILTPKEIIRSSDQEKKEAIDNLNRFKERNKSEATKQLRNLKNTATENDNIFQSLMEASQYCTLGQMTHALYGVGGQFRRNM